MRGERVCTNVCVVGESYWVKVCVLYLQQCENGDV